MKFVGKYGGFSDDGREYIITDPRTPRPWGNVISNGDYSFLVSQTGSGYSWRGNAGENRITRSYQDLIKDNWGKYLYIRDTDSGAFWSAAWNPVQAAYQSYRVRHGVGYSIFEHKVADIASVLRVFVSPDKPMEFMELTLTNEGGTARRLDVTSYFELALGFAPDEHREYHKLFINTAYDEARSLITANKLIWFGSNASWEYTFFHTVSQKASSFDTDKQTLIGGYRSERDPQMMDDAQLAGRQGRFTDACASLRTPVELAPGESKTVVFTLGAAKDGAEQVQDLAAYTTPEAAKREFEAVGAFWSRYIDAEWVETPDEAMNFMTNIWMKYQAISCRLWGKSGLYQVSAGFGFRDQLQDCQIFLENRPEEARKQILLHASKQFAAGDVYHWWFTISGTGPQSNCSDDLLWLPFILSAYLKETGDYAILDEVAPYVDEGEGDLYDHCKRAIEKCFSRFSPRGVPLMGDHDWNDGLSEVGAKMKGESFWVAEFLYTILADFIPLCRRRGDEAFAKKCEEVRQTMAYSVNRYGWDGEWYLQATTDAWEDLGSAKNEEGKIFLNPNIWAVISGIAEPEKAAKAMQSVEKHLLREYGALLLYPAYTKPRSDLGYITRYAPGLRENGGVYTHAATWAVWAYALMKDSRNAYKAYRTICPPNRSDDQDAYVAEPYVTPGNSDGPISPYFGKGGWSWYTGSAQWLHRVAVFWILGIRPEEDGLVVDPCIPAEWKEYRVKRRFRGAEYRIHVTNPDGRTGGIRKLLVDGREVEGNRIPSLADGGIHLVEATV
ncbi:MAG TPA: glycosyl transferase family 36 [Firmicutes bacterium]|nr:glycosyl transferase family 36 [Bacillota bacterium]